MPNENEIVTANGQRWYIHGDDLCCVATGQHFPGHFSGDGATRHLFDYAVARTKEVTDLKAEQYHLTNDVADLKAQVQQLQDAYSICNGARERNERENEGLRNERDEAIIKKQRLLIENAVLKHRAKQPNESKLRAALRDLCDDLQRRHDSGLPYQAAVVAELQRILADNPPEPAPAPTMEYVECDGDTAYTSKGYSLCTKCAWRSPLQITTRNPHYRVVALAPQEEKAAPQQCHSTLFNIHCDKPEGHADDHHWPEPEPAQPSPVSAREKLIQALDEMMWAFTGRGVKGTETTAVADALIDARRS